MACNIKKTHFTFCKILFYFLCSSDPHLVHVCGFYCLLFVMNWLVASMCSYPSSFLNLVKINYRELYNINLNDTIWYFSWRFTEELLTHIFFEYIHAYRQTNSIKHIPSWEANKPSAGQEIPRNLWNPKIHYSITSSRHLFLSWASPIQSMPSHPTSLKIHFNI